jgi:5-methylthioadenosine/S-adenosylhomocysteine deaminase
MILSASWVLPIISPPIESGAVLVKGNLIADVGSLESLRTRNPGEVARHFDGAALLPGLVNVHSHLELSILRGYLEGLDFWSWIRRLTRTKYEILNRDDLLTSALLGASEAIRAGITTVADPMDIGTSFDAVVTSGLRGLLYQEIFSPKPEEAEAVVEGLTDKMRRLQEKQAGDIDAADRVALGLSPHAPFTVSGRLFQLARQFADMSNLRTCVHIGESEAEVRFLKDGSGQMGDSLRQRGIDWRAPGCTPVEYLHRLGILTPSTLLVHCVQLASTDFQLLKSSGASVAHCPKSNWRLGHGFMDMHRMRQFEIPLGLGSDSVASNNTMDLFEEMRFVLSNPYFYSQFSQETCQRLDSSEALRIATLGGAEAIGMSRQIGSLEAGKQADCIAVNMTAAHMIPVFSPVDALVYSARASDVMFTMVAGRVLFDEAKILSFPEVELATRVGEVRKKLLNAL